MKRASRLARWGGLVLAIACAAFFAGRVLAGGIPATGALTYSGLLQDANGAPLTGAHNIQVALWPAATGGTTPACQTTSASLTLNAGRFSVTLPDSCTTTIQANADAWVEVLVEGASLGRSKLGAVPYAVEAAHASTAGAPENGGALAQQLATLTSRLVTAETKLASMPKVFRGNAFFVGGTCSSVSAPCSIDITAAGFQAAPECVLTMNNQDGTGYTEHMTIKGITATAILVWKGQFTDAGTTMVVHYLCVGS